MELVGTLGPVLIAEVLILSFGFKVLRGEEYATALASFTALDRLPSVARRLVGLVVPSLELVIAVLILMPQTRAAGIAGGISLVGSFSIAVALDKRPSITRCGCWGSMSIEVPKWAYLARNFTILGVLTISLVLDSVIRGTTLKDVGAAAGMAIPFALLTLELPHFLHVVSARSARALG